MDKVVVRSHVCRIFCLFFCFTFQNFVTETVAIHAYVNINIYLCFSYVLLVHLFFIFLFCFIAFRIHSQNAKKNADEFEPCAYCVHSCYCFIIVVIIFCSLSLSMRLKFQKDDLNSTMAVYYYEWGKIYSISIECVCVCVCVIIANFFSCIKVFFYICRKLFCAYDWNICCTHLHTHKHW